MPSPESPQKRTVASSSRSTAFFDGVDAVVIVGRNSFSAGLLTGWRKHRSAGCRESCHLPPQAVSSGRLVILFINHPGKTNGWCAGCTSALSRRFPRTAVEGQAGRPDPPDRYAPSRSFGGWFGVGGRVL